MLHPVKLLVAVVVVAAVSALPSISKAESSKSGAASSKTEAMKGDKKDQGAVDEFEENRRAHMQKSKENNANKGAN